MSNEDLAEGIRSLQSRIYELASELNSRGFSISGKQEDYYSKHYRGGGCDDNYYPSKPYRILISKSTITSESL